MPRKGEFVPFGERRPDLLAQYAHDLNQLRPESLGLSDRRAVYWRCAAGPDHVWQQSVRVRHKRPLGRGCPFCTGHAVSVTNSLASRSPAVAAELDAERSGFTAQEVTYGNKSAQAYWRCRAHGHVWGPMTVNARTNPVKPQSCPKCSGRQVIPGETSLQAVAPSWFAEWDHGANETDPDTIGPFHGQPVRWRCAYGHRWSAPPRDRHSGGTCPHCARRRRRAGSFASVHPELLAELVGDLAGNSPHATAARSHQVARWRCLAVAAHPPYETSYDSRSRGEGCPYCAEKLVAPGESLADLYPDLAATCVPAKGGPTPQELTPGSNVVLSWACPDVPEHPTWPAPVKRRTRQQTGCPQCSRVWGTSFREIGLRALLGLVHPLTEDRTVTVSGRLREVDIMFADLPVVVEYDGCYFHASEEDRARDLGKTLALHTQGFVVVRVREHPLPPVTENDVACRSTDDIVAVAHRVLARVPQLIPGAPAAVSLDPGLARQALVEAREELGSLRRAADLARVRKSAPRTRVAQ